MRQPDDHDTQEHIEHLDGKLSDASTCSVGSSQPITRKEKANAKRIDIKIRWIESMQADMEKMPGREAMEKCDIDINAEIRRRPQDAVMLRQCHRELAKYLGDALAKS